MGFEERPPTPDEMRSMKDHIDEAMRAGARDSPPDKYLLSDHGPPGSYE